MSGAIGTREARLPASGAPRHAGQRPGVHRHGTTLVFLVLLAVACVMLLPFYWMLSSSLRTMENMFSVPIQWIPDPVNWQSYGWPGRRRTSPAISSTAASSPSRSRCATCCSARWPATA